MADGDVSASAGIEEVPRNEEDQSSDRGDSPGPEAPAERVTSESHGHALGRFAGAIPSRLGKPGGRNGTDRTRERA